MDIAEAVVTVAVADTAAAAEEEATGIKAVAEVTVDTVAIAAERSRSDDRFGKGGADYKKGGGGSKNYTRSLSDDDDD
jgi:hypothetical protein